MCYRMMKLFHNLASGTCIQNGNFVALGIECVGYHVAAPKAAAGASRRARRSFFSRNGEAGASRLPGRAAALVCRSRGRIPVSSQASLAHRRLPNCAEVGVYLRGDVGLECRYAGGNWRMGVKAIRQLFRGSDSSTAAPDSSSSFPSPGGYASNRVAARPSLPPPWLPAMSNVSSLHHAGIHHQPHRAGSQASVHRGRRARPPGARPLARRHSHPRRPVCRSRSSRTSRATTTCRCGSASFLTSAIRSSARLPRKRRPRWSSSIGSCGPKRIALS